MAENTVTWFLLNLIEGTEISWHYDFVTMYDYMSVYYVVN